MFLHGIRLNHCKRLLSREEEADLSFGLFVTGAAVKLIDRIVLYSELRSEADGGRTLTSAAAEASMLITQIKDFLLLIKGAFVFST